MLGAASAEKSKWLRMLLACSLVLSLPGLYAAPEVDAAEEGEIVEDFEAFEKGSLDGQFGWSSSPSGVTVTDEVYAVSGLQTVKIEDTSTTAAVNAAYRIDPIRKGFVEWWGKAASRDRMVTLLEDTDGALKRVEWFGFTNSGNFEYFDGEERLYTDYQYTVGEWYQFRIDFDADVQKKTVYIFDEAGRPVFIHETAFRENAAHVNQLRFATMSNRLGTFYIDNIRIRNEEIAGSGELQEVMVFPEDVQMRIGESVKLEVLGRYAGVGLRTLDETPVIVSLNEEVARVEDGRIVGGSAGEAVLDVYAGGFQVQARVVVYDPDEVPPHYDFTPRPLAKTTPLEGLIIYAPEDENWMQLARQIQSGIEERFGVGVTIASAEQHLFENGWSGNVLMLGNLGNHWGIARLYGMLMSYADAMYPGEGGYRLQTIVDPFGRGGNTVLLAASDLFGAQVGAASLLEKIQAIDEPVIPWLDEAKLSERTSSYVPYHGKPTEEDQASMLARADEMLAQLRPTTAEADADALYAVFNDIANYGEYYLLTGENGFGAVYRKLLKGYSNYVNSYPGIAQQQLNYWRNMWGVGDSLINHWTVLEADPMFTDLDRKQILSAFYITYQANSEDDYLNAVEETGPRFNHEVFPALSILSAGDYFDRYFQLPEMQDWIALGKRVFENNTSIIGLDEGSDYLMHVPMSNIDYGMLTGDLSYLLRTLRPSADLNALMMNNLGTMAGGGDTYPFGYSGSYSWGHSQVMNAAAWFYGNPVYQYLQDKAITGIFPNQRMTDWDYPFHRYMALPPQQEEPGEEFPKVLAYSMDPGVYDHLAETETVNVSFEDAFHKLAFRYGFGTEDSYLVIDGLSAGAHGHQDGNAILEYSVNERIFLTDRDYIEKTPQHHTGVVVVKDGEQHPKPPLVQLQWVAEVDGMALSRSQVSEYNGLDWERTVFTPNGKYFVILDDLQFREPGRYVLQNIWQSMGEAQILRDTFVVEQQGVFMSLQSLDDSDLRIHERYGHFKKYFKSDYPYPFADTESILTEVKGERAFAAGDAEQFINVLGSHKAGERPVQARRVNRKTVELKDRSQTYWAVSGSAATQRFTSNGKFHWVGDDTVFAAGATEITVNGERLSFDEPVLFLMDGAIGTWSAYSVKKELARYDESGEPIREGPLHEGSVLWSSQDQKALIREISKQEPPAAWHKPDYKYETPHFQWRKIHQFDGEIADSAAGDLDGDGADDLVAGGKDGRIEAIRSDGTLLWSFEAGGRINEISVQELNGRSVVFAATEDWFVHALQSDGTLMWSREFPSDPQHAERKGNLLGITNVRVANVNGNDQEPLIMVGTQFRYLYGLDAHGNIVSESVLSHYGIEDMEFADADGDGKEEGLIAMEYTSYNYWNEGSFGRAGGGDGPGWKVVDAIPDWFGPGRAAFFLGTKQNKVLLVTRSTSSGMMKWWDRNIGGEVNDLAHADIDGDGSLELLAVSDGYQFYALEEDGSVRFRLTLDGRVQRVSSWERAGRYLASDDRGVLYIVNDQGTLENSIQFPSKIIDISAANLQVPWIVLENGDIYQYRR